MICKYCQEEFCTNEQCPMYADYCPVNSTAGICKYEELVEECYTLTPKGCLQCALLKTNIKISAVEFETVWSTFFELMQRCGYIQE